MKLRLCSASLVALFALAVGCGGPAARAPIAIEVVARGLSTGYAFVPSTLTAPPQTAIALRLVNQSDAPHTLVALAPIDRRTDVIVQPDGHDVLQLTTPGPGSYRFVCTVHEQMSGTLVVTDAAAP